MRHIRDIWILGPGSPLNLGPWGISETFGYWDQDPHLTWAHEAYPRHLDIGTRIPTFHPDSDPVQNFTYSTFLYKIPTVTFSHLSIWYRYMFQGTVTLQLILKFCKHILIYLWKLFDFKSFNDGRFGHSLSYIDQRKKSQCCSQQNEHFNITLQGLLYTSFFFTSSQ